MGTQALSIPVSTADALAASGQVQIYGKLVAGSTELFMRSSAGVVSQVAGIAAALTLGSVPFANASGQLTQDNANFFYDVATHRLGIGNAAPTTPLDVTGVARATNVTISAMTAGSVLFAGAAGAVTQDNANAFWDNTNKWLGLGTASPVTTLTLGGPANTVGIQMANGSAVTASAANTGRLIYTTTGQKWQISANTGAFVDVAAYAAALTSGSVIFANGSNQLAQDNANFFYDSTAHKLGLGVGSTFTGTTRLNIKTLAASEGARIIPADTSSIADLLFIAVDAATTKGGIGYSESLAGGTLASKNFLFSPGAGVDWVVSDSATNWLRLYCTTGSFGMEFQNGQSASVSVVGTGKIRYNQSLTPRRFQTSIDNGTYFDSPQMEQTIASSAIVFGNTNTRLTQDLTGVFGYDNVNKRLFIGTGTPDLPVHIKSNLSADAQCLKLQAGLNTSYADMIWSDFANVQKGGVGFGGAGVTGLLATFNFLYSPGAGVDWVIGDGATNWIRWNCTTGSVAQQFTDGTSASTSAVNTGKLAYFATGQKFKVAANAGSYFDVATYAAALTTGSVLFANASNQILQDNANFFWDDTNNRLGIGNAAPGTALDVTGTIRASAGITLTALTQGSVVFSGASGALTQDNANFFWDDTNNRLGLGTASPQNQLHVVGTSRFDSFIDLQAIAAGNSNFVINGTSDTPTDTWGLAAGNMVSAVPAGYLEITVSGMIGSRYIPFWS